MECIDQVAFPTTTISGEGMKTIICGQSVYQFGSHVRSECAHLTFGYSTHALDALYMEGLCFYGWRCSLDTLSHGGKVGL